ncbi:ABC transporter [Lasiodiplodia theobromae]|nr:ABC transporter [Lasiodiplodia theobromae]
MVYKVGEKCHNRMLDIVMRVPIAFFALNDTGKTTNRFGQDLQLLDTVLPMSAINTALFAGSCLVQIVIISYAANYMAATLPVCLVVVYMVQRYYLNTSRQLRVLEIEAKTPLYSAFIELLDGLATVRAFRWEQTLEKSNYRKVQDSQTAMYLLFCIQRWLNLVLDLIVAGLAITLACLAVGLKEKSNASSIGVALSNINTFNQTLANLIKAWTTLETTMGAVARIRSFVKETKVMKHPNGNLTSTPRSESLAGMLEFQDVSASYGINDDDLALSGVNMSIKQGEKIAICGRTGSGKSTLILCLSRMLELASGSIMINGVNVALLSPDQVCSSLNIITQEPLIISGTVRFNASLGNSASEAELLSAFQTVGIWDLIQEKGGLDAEMQPASWSHGQRQLFCLARALLYKKPILILDEAASNVDSATEQQMQDVVNTAFRDNTVISVTHRLGSIFCYDKVAVFDKGILVEYDDPHALLEKPSVFAELYRESGAQ